MRRTAAVLVLLACAVPAKADPASERMLRDLLASIDASEDWTASARSIRSEGDETVAEGLLFSLNEPTVRIAVERLQLSDLRGIDEGFSTSATELTGGTVKTDLVDYSMPSATIDDLSMPGIAGLTFDPERIMSSLGSYYSALAQAEMDELRIPELTGVARQPASPGAAPVESRFTYRDMVISGLSDGVLQRQEMGPIEASGTDPEGSTFQIRLEKVLAERLDLGAFAHILDTTKYRGDRGDGIWRPLVSRVVYSGFSGQGDDGTSFRLDEIAVENLDGRQPDQPLAKIWDRILNPDFAPEAKQELALEATQAIVRAWRVGAIRLGGMAAEAPAEAGTFSLGGITLAGLSADGLDSLLLKGFRGAAPGGFFALDSFEVAGFRFPDLEAMMKFAALESEADPREHEETIRSTFAALPRLAHVGLDGLAAGLSETDAVKVARFAVDLRDWNELFAQSTDITLEGLEVPRQLMQLDANTAQMLDTMGLEQIVLGMSLADRWNPETGEDKGVWTFQMQDAADLELSYTLSGVTLDWMLEATAAAAKSDGSTGALMTMLADIKLNRAALTATDRSLLDRGFALAAKMQNLTVDGPAYRSQMRGALPFLLSTVVPANIAKLLTGPLQSFMVGGQSLTAEIAPAEPIPFPEVMGLADVDPAELPEKLNLTLRSEPAAP